jgi:Domain of unknown function (DUF1823)
MSTVQPLTTETLWAIIRETIDDDAVNHLVWHYLGYSQNTETLEWSNADTDWADAYPTPPNFIESRPATVKLTRSIPAENKQLLKTKLGFEGYSINELIPRKTRRATMVNWLLSYAVIHNLPLD